MKKNKFILKCLAVIFLTVSFGVKSSFAGDEKMHDHVSLPADYETRHKDVIPQYETEKTKEQITAVALSGFKILYEEGKKFADDIQMASVMMDDIEKTYACAFAKDNSLLRVGKNNLDLYKTCIIKAGILVGSKDSGLIFSKKDFEMFEGLERKGAKEKFLYSYINKGRLYNSAAEHYPGPLALIYSAIKNIGVKVLVPDYKKVDCSQCVDEEGSFLKKDGYFRDYNDKRIDNGECQKSINGDGGCADDKNAYCACCELDDAVKNKGRSNEEIKSRTKCYQNFAYNPREEFVNVSIDILVLIKNRHKIIGKDTYVNLMTTKLKRLQSIVDKYVRHKISKISEDSLDDSALDRLFFTEELLGTFGDKVYVENSRARASKELGLKQSILLKNKFDELLKLYGFDKTKSLDERKAKINELENLVEDLEEYMEGDEFADKTAENKKRRRRRAARTEEKIDSASALKLGNNILSLYHYNDKNTGKEGARDMGGNRLNDAFRPDKILSIEDSTLEYDIKKREEDRKLYNMRRALEKQEADAKKKVMENANEQQPVEKEVNPEGDVDEINLQKTDEQNSTKDLEKDSVGSDDEKTDEL